MSVVGSFIVPHPPIILPEVGRGEERKIHKTVEAYREIAKQISDLKPDIIVVTSPHATRYADYFHISPGKNARGDLQRFGVNSVSLEVRYDEEFVRELSATAENEGIPAGTMGEQEKFLDHGTLIPLYFIKQFYTDYRVVRIGLSGLGPVEHYQLGKSICKAAEKRKRNIVFVASGDLSHRLKEEGPYGYAPQGPEFDEQITKAMKDGDFLSILSFQPSFCEAAAECGLRSFIIMAGVLDGKAVNSKLLSYEGTFGVGYAVASFYITGEDENRHFDRTFQKMERKRLTDLKQKEDEYVHLARFSLETYIKTGKRAPLPDKMPKEMKTQRAGVFVSLKKYGQLRGCIGTISPTTGSVAEEILHNAVSAGTQDPRFSPVTEEELPDIVYSVDVLAEPEPIHSVDELNVKRYGVIVADGHRRGLLLPNLEGVDTPKQQVTIALQKAGIQPNQSYTMERFEVIRHI